MDKPLPFASLHPRRRLLLHGILVILLWPALMIFPYPPESYLDASWQITLIEAHVRGWQFGRDIIFTWGPWGFLHSIFHLGDAAAGVRLLWEILGKLLLAIGLVTGSRHLSIPRHIVFILICVCFVPIFQDTAYLLYITLSVITVLLRSNVSRGELVAVVVGLAFFAQIKFTYTLLATSGICIALLLQFYRRRWANAVFLGSSFILLFILWWCAAGQNPYNIIPYLSWSWQISTGYPDAMSLDGTYPVLISGLTVLLFHGWFFWKLWRKHIDHSFATAVALFLAFAWFLIWKHGFTRADGHVMGFFLYGIAISVLASSLCFPDLRRHWLDFSLIPCLAGLWFFDPALLVQLPGKMLTTLRGNAQSALQVNTLIPLWRHQLEQSRTAEILPVIKRTVGTATVDLYNFEQGALLLNGLNYHPRPIFQSYSAYTPVLAEQNMQFYRSPAAPDFLLWHHSSIDGRFPTLDDAPLIAELPSAYSQIMTEEEFLLLHRTKPFSSKPLVRKSVLNQTIRLGESITLPSAHGHALWVQILTKATLLGRLRSIFYKPALLTLTVEEVTGRGTTWRLLPRIAEDGFLLYPFLENQSDFSAYLQGRVRKQIHSIQLDAPNGGRKFWNDAEIRFQSIPSLQVENEDPYLEYVEQGIASMAPTIVSAPVSPEIFAVGSVQAILLHAPASMEFAIPPEVTRVQADFGLRPGAYSDGGMTDGVEFSLIANSMGGHTEVIWRHTLDPVHNRVDVGIQHLDIALPSETPYTLIFKAHPGPKGNTDWDWSYWANIRFTPTSTP